MNIRSDGKSLTGGGNRLEPLVSRKLVYREVCSEGSETTNSGTDEQELDMRLDKPDEQAHHCDVQKPEKECVY